MRLIDLRPLYDFVASNHTHGEPIVVYRSLASPLIHYHPELRGDVRPWAIPPNSEAIWCVGPDADLKTTSRKLEFRLGDAVVIRKTEAQPSSP